MGWRRRAELLGVAAQVVGNARTLAVHALRHVGVGVGVVNGNAEPTIEQLPPASSISVAASDEQRDERARSLAHVRLASRTFRAQTQLADWCADDEVASVLRRLGVQGAERDGVYDE